MYNYLKILIILTLLISIALCVTACDNSGDGSNNGSETTNNNGNEINSVDSESSSSESQNNSEENTVESAYSQYQEKLQILTTQYNADVTGLQTKIEESKTKIKDCEKDIDKAESQLASLSKSCPTWFLQRYLNIAQDGNVHTNLGSSLARFEWEREYVNQKNQFNNTISMKKLEISGYQTNISLYSTQIELLTYKYNTDVNALKSEYGID